MVRHYWAPIGAIKRVTYTAHRGISPWFDEPHPRHINPTHGDIVVEATDIMAAIFL